MYIVKTKTGRRLFSPDVFSSKKAAREALIYAINGSKSMKDKDVYLQSKVLKKPKKK